MNINVTKTAQNIVVNINGVNNTLEFNTDIYLEFLKYESDLDECETREDADKVIKTAEDRIKEIKSTTWAENDSFEVIVEGLLVKCKKSEKLYLIAKGERVDMPFPDSLTYKIMTAISSESDFMPLIKAWTRFLRNPNLTYAKASMFGKYITSTYVDQEQYDSLLEQDYAADKAIEMATYPGVSITKEGFLCCYKYVELEMNKYDQETGEKVLRYKHSFDETTGELKLDDSLCAEDLYFIPSMMRYNGDEFTADGELGHRVKVGALHELDSWDMVDCNDTYSCRPGLHLGGRQYVTGFGGKSSWLMECFVDPSQIGAFDHSGNGAIRCKSYYVHNIKSTPVRGLYHSSTYAKLTEARWELERETAINEANELIAALQKKQRVLQSI